MWDGSTWNAVGSGFDGPGQILALAMHGSILYAVGQFTVAGNVIADNVAVWNGSEWDALGEGIPTGSLLHGVHSLEVDSTGRLYAGGQFTASGGAPGDNLAVWDGSAWRPFGDEIDFGPILALASDEQDNLYVGGLIWGGYGHIMKWIR